MPFAQRHLAQVISAPTGFKEPSVAKRRSILLMAGRIRDVIVEFRRRQSVEPCETDLQATLLQEIRARKSRLGGMH
jgi:hypothetical protein